MNAIFPRGSEWRKWDLQVHTPSSLVHNYTSSQPWDKFIRELEQLPSEFKVIGINDYIFIDGYKRILEEKAKGRLSNIELFLPVIELRLDKFGGSQGHLSRVNYHIIFSNEVAPELIEQHFLNALSSKYTLAPQHDHLRKTGVWAALPTRQSLEDLGKLIINSVPETERDQFGVPLIEGFNNLCISLKAINEALQSHYFKGKVLTAVGKTEWADIKWNDHSIAEKKTIINDADLVFISSATAEGCIKAKQNLKDSGVNDRLLDCSDAHCFIDVSNKDRIGKCFTWIKADPTFEGLKQIINEPDRVFIGMIPDSLKRVTIRPTRIINTLNIRKSSETGFNEKWFNMSLPLSSELVAIIGNKGSGKSALADSIGLLGNAPRYDSFSFLRPDRFRDPKNNKARHYEATLSWQDGTIEGPISLDKNPTPNSVEKVKYIPQNYLEEICNEITLGKGSRFYEELQKVIFSHVSESEKLGFETLDDLLYHRSEETNQAIELLLSQLRQVNKQIVGYEERHSPDYRKALEARLDEKRRELEAHEQARPKDVAKPEDDAATQQQVKNISEVLEKNMERLKELEKQITDIKKSDSKYARKYASAEKLLSKIMNLQRQVSAIIDDAKAEFEELELQSDQIITLNINTKPIETLINISKKERQKIAKELDPLETDSLENKRIAVATAIKQLRLKLSEPQQEYQNYIQKLKEWEKVKDGIIGKPDIAGSLNNLEQQITDLANLPSIINGLSKKRVRISLEILKEKLKLKAYYANYYGAVQSFLNKHPLASHESFRLTFDVSMRESGFIDTFLDMINQRKYGPFAGKEEGRVVLKDFIDKTNWDSASQTIRFSKKLLSEMKQYGGRDLQPKDQLREGIGLEKLYNFIFSFEYLIPIYNLKWDQKILEQLSPGERGNLLLIFYLIVDQDDIPLVIDQPEENLDNQTVYKTLVPCIKDAKQRRQIIIVTHNPNLAVVCDAEQIIYAEIHKDKDNEVIYESGSIENPLINKRIIDVLEGTRPAFDKRDEKYLPERGI